MIRFAAVAALACMLALPLLANAKDEAAYRKIEAQLTSTTIPTLIYEETDFTEIVKDIAKRAKVTIVIEKAALESVADEDRKITIELVEIKATNALNIVIDEVGLFRVYKNGVLYITTEDKAKGVTITKTYEVRDITAKIIDFPAPKMRLKADSRAGGGPEIEIPDEKEPITTDDIVEMIEDTVKADWGDTASITIVKGNLIVRAPRDVHKEVAKLLGQLRGSK